jgi:DNA-binding NtrC family response regulator
MASFTVLFVDDETEFVASLIKRMQQRDINAYGAHSGAEALTILESRNTLVDVVVMDVKMPGMDGITVLKEIKDRYPLIEVIMLSGHANVSVALEGLEKGAFDYLVKPVDMDELLYKLQDANEKKRLSEQCLPSSQAATPPSDY